MAIAYRSGSTAGNSSGGNLSITKPTGVVDNDILVAVLYREAGSWTLPSGWAQWGSDQRDFNTQLYLSAVWKRASGEPASWTFNLSATTWRVIAMGAFSGCVLDGDPLDAGPVGRGTNEVPVNNVPIASSITTLVANAMRVAIHGNFNGVDITAGISGMSQGAQLGGCEIWYAAQASAGASGNKEFDGLTGSDQGDWATLHLSLKPDVGGVFPPVPRPLRVSPLVRM